MMDNEIVIDNLMKVQLILHFSYDLWMNEIAQYKYWE